MRLSAKIAAIEYEGDEVRLAVVKTGGRLPVVLELHAERAAYDTPEARSEALTLATRHVLSRVQSRPSAYVLCAGSEFSVIRTLTIPFRGNRRVAAAVPFELEPYLAFPIEELVVDFVPIREVDSQTEVLAVGMRRAFLEEQLAPLIAAGINPEGIGIDAAGLAALWQGRRRPSSGLSAVLHVRDQGAILVIAHQKSIAFFRHIPVTAADLRQNPAGAARQVKNLLRAFQAQWNGEGEFTELTVTGLTLEAAHHSHTQFEEGVSLPVRYENLLTGLKGRGLAAKDDIPVPPEPAPIAGEDASVPGPAPLEHANYWEVAVGVAMAAAGGVPALQFRKDELAPPNLLRSMMRHVVFSAGLAVLFLMVYAGYCVLDYRHNVAETDLVGQLVWDSYAEAFPDDPRVQEGRPADDLSGVQAAQNMEDNIGKMADTASADMLALLERPSLLDILAEISQRMPGVKVRVTDLIIRPGDNDSQRITITGEVTDQAGFNEAFDNLKQSTLFRVDEDAQQIVKANKQTFVITATLGQENEESSD